ncbi:hypothetical protein H5407_09245 [Mitsuaria sp. WAJ17]|uniref:hypothetical protein n=1 Tax=Mitsuaria sp. WAJ17 TaxID=2761452 RepID=UPI0015FF2115|nr:hypothetical protein [Mitsuaria sp. WAJ17]MBB2485411.1 hypothetical protein [Mitsuaria sp. WAJ17]
MIDLKNQLDVVQSLAPAARNASANGTGVDTVNYNGVMAVAECGALTDGTHTPVLQESDDNSVFSPVAAGQLVGAFAPLATNTVQRVGYAGTKRYLRLALTVAGATTGAVTSGVIVGGALRKAP